MAVQKKQKKFFSHFLVFVFFLHISNSFAKELKISISSKSEILSKTAAWDGMETDKDRKISVKEDCKTCDG